MIDEDFYSPEFKTEFWDWFDALPRHERVKFQTYPSDMSELYFYNKVYRYKAGILAK